MDNVTATRNGTEDRQGQGGSGAETPSQGKARLTRLPKHRDVVAYCRGPYCVMALDAVDLLKRRGFRAHRMEHGILEWRSRGWRVETGDEPRTGTR